MSGTENHHQSCAGPVAFNSTLDRAGIFLSGLCMVHCLVVPMLLFFMPTLLSGIEDSTHEVLVWVVTPLAILALVQGYLRHRCLSPLIVGLTGLTFMLASLLLEDILHGNLTYHSLLMLAAGACLLIAHAKNLRKDCKAEGD